MVQENFFYGIRISELIWIGSVSHRNVEFVTDFFVLLPLFRR